MGLFTNFFLRMLGGERPGAQFQQPDSASPMLLLLHRRKRQEEPEEPEQDEVNNATTPRQQPSHDFEF